MTALLALLLAQSPLSPYEVRAGVAVSGSSYAHAGGRWGDSVGRLFAEGSFSLWPFAAEVGGAYGAPLTPGGASGGFTATARLGFHGRTPRGLSYRLTLGALVQHASAARPKVQLLPTLRARVANEELGLKLGLFEHHGLMPLHLTADVGDFSLGWVLPMGVLGEARIRLTPRWSFAAAAFAFRLANAEVAMVSVSAVYAGGRP